MIQFLVTAVFAVIVLFLLALLLCLMIWVVAKLLRFLFPHKFAVPAPVPGQKEKKGKKKHKNQPDQIVPERMEDRCKSCADFGSCPAAFSGVVYPCRYYAEKQDDPQ